MLRISIIVLCLRTVPASLDLSVIKAEDGVNTFINNTVEVQRGKSFALTCFVRYTEQIDDNTLWTKENDTVALHELRFHRVRLKDQGEYTCSSYALSLRKSVELRVLPKTVSAKLKREVYEWIYPVRRVRSDSGSSSSSSSFDASKTKRTKSEDYLEFWLVVIIIVTVGLGIFFVYYLLKRYWWKGSTRRSCQSCHRLMHNRQVVCELGITEDVTGTALNEPNCDLPPSYREHVMNDLPPSYDEVVRNGS